MFAELLRSKMAGICELPEAQIARLKVHYELLTRWNRVLSLTSVRTLEETVERHYCESVFTARHLPEGAASSPESLSPLCGRTVRLCWLSRTNGRRLF